MSRNRKEAVRWLRQAKYDHQAAQVNVVSFVQDLLAPHDSSPETQDLNTSTDIADSSEDA